MDLEIKKSEKANLDNGKLTALLMGFVVVLGLMFVALEWTQREKEIDLSGIIVADLVFEEEKIPITLPEKKTVPPPPQSTAITEIIQVVDNDAEIEETTIASTEDQTEFINVDDYEEIVVEEEIAEEPPFQIVEDMPEFPGGAAALMEYLKKNIKYPQICRENNIQGRVLIKFVVNKDGSIVDPEVIKSVNPYLDKEALRVISGMPAWKPGKQRGQAVRVNYTVPVSFKLN
ncbi:MAG: energy transducer TonB [Bacteroidaceae bacterium]|nr:energy transducer TonB [Bacteroidaceae bacterium]